jgi:hypothetical protein
LKKLEKNWKTKTLLKQKNCDKNSLIKKQIITCGEKGIKKQGDFFFTGLMDSH